MKGLLLFLIKLNLTRKDNYQGFTLIELLVVVIIIGVLSAISLPNLLSQIGKARETEAKNNLGTLSRSQQAYRLEKQTFADTLDKLTLNVSINSRYYNYLAPDDASTNLVKHRAEVIDPTTSRVRNYAIGVYYNSGAMQTSFCQSFDVDQTVNVGDTASDSCTNGGIKIK